MEKNINESFNNNIFKLIVSNYDDPENEEIDHRVYLARELIEQKIFHEINQDINEEEIMEESNLQGEEGINFKGEFNPSRNLFTNVLSGEEIIKKAAELMSRPSEEEVK